MKRSIVTSVVLLLSVVLGENLIGAQELLLCNEFGLKDTRREHFYPVLTIQSLGRVARVNQQLSQEIGNVSMYRDVDFEDLKNIVQSAWVCYGEMGCSPKIKLCFIEAPRFENVFHVRQEQLVAHWIKNVVRSGIWREGRDCLIGKDEGGHSLSFDGNNHILLKQSNADCSAICIDRADMKQEGNFNSVMTIYSIGHHNKTLNQEEFNAFVNNAIKKPLVIALDQSLMDNEEILQMLLAHFRQLSAESNNITGPCLQYLDLQYEKKKMVQKANQELRELFAKLELKDSYADQNKENGKDEPEDAIKYENVAQNMPTAAGGSYVSSTPCIIQ